jgi:plastocyanin
VSRWRAALLGVCAGTLLLASPAAADQRVSAATRDQYSNPDVTIDPGEHVTFFNGDLFDSHSVTSKAQRPDGTPLFDSGVIRSGAEAPVAGVEGLAPGTYPFYCSIHTFMTGTITVRGGGGSGGPPPPPPSDTTAPRASLAIGTGNLAAVLRSGRLPVRVSVDEGASLALTATTRVGRRTVTLATGRLSFGGPAVQSTRARLTRGGRRSLAGRRSATVAVTATATDPAGNRSRATAHRTLRR